MTEAERQARRQHQIDLGKATQGYKNLTVLRRQGKIREGPKTPDPTVKVSKRQFDKEIREWRRKLHAFDDVIFDNSQKEHTPETRERSFTPSSVSSEGLRSSKQSLSPDSDPNYILRKRIEDLVLTNHLYMERLRQQDRFIHSLIEADLGSSRPLYSLDRDDSFRLPEKRTPVPPWYDQYYGDNPQEAQSSWKPWLDSRYRDEMPQGSSDAQPPYRADPPSNAPYQPWMDKQIQNHGHPNQTDTSDRDSSLFTAPDKLYDPQIPL